MSREEKYTIKCDRCGNSVSFENVKTPPEDLKGWRFLEVHSLLADAEETGSLIAFLTRGKYFDLCGVCFQVLEDTIHNFLPLGILKAFEETKEKPADCPNCKGINGFCGCSICHGTGKVSQPEGKTKDGGESEQKENGAAGTDP